MQETFPHTINYNIVPIYTKYKLDDNLEADKFINIILYTIEFPFVNLNVSINSFIYCSLIDYSNIKDKIKTYIKMLEQLETSTTIDNINNILNNNELFGKDILLLNDINDILHNDDTSKFIESGSIIKEIDKLSYDELYNKNIIHFSHLNKYIINKLNNSKNNIYSDVELASFTSTFFNIILKSYKDNNKDENNTQLDNISYISESKDELIYIKVMNYYIQSKNDTTSSDIDLILSSIYNSVKHDWDTDNVTSSCGCNAISNSNNILNTTSCFNIYKQAMLTWLQQMMSDIENFYYKYFTIKSTTDDGKECYNINNDLIDDLLELIKEFKNVGYDLSFKSTNTSKFRNCNCETDNSSLASDCNYKTIKNFENVLYFIKEDKIDENYNKIKLIGKEFAILLDKLYF